MAESTPGPWPATLSFRCQEPSNLAVTYDRQPSHPVIWVVVALSAGSPRGRHSLYNASTVSRETSRGERTHRLASTGVWQSADRAVVQLAGMQQPARPADRLNSEPIRVVVDTTGPPVLNEAAAVVLLRILLRAVERPGMTDAQYSATRPVPSDS